VLRIARRSRCDIAHTDGGAPSVRHIARRSRTLLRLDAPDRARRARERGLRLLTTRRTSLRTSASSSGSPRARSWGTPAFGRRRHGPGETG